jgi:hypothetical protein
MRKTMQAEMTVNAPSQLPENLSAKDLRSMDPTNPPIPDITMDPTRSPRSQDAMSPWDFPPRMLPMSRRFSKALMSPIQHPRIVARTDEEDVEPAMAEAMKRVRTTSKNRTSPMIRPGWSMAT